MSEQDNLVKEFLVESYENLDQLDRDFVELEKDPTDRGRLGSIFRTVHTIKGTCGFFGFSRLEKLAHSAENLLSRLRDGLLAVTPEITTALLTAMDAVRRMLASIDQTGSEGDAEHKELIAQLERLQEAPKEQPEPPPEPAKPAAKPKAMGEILVEEGLAKPREVLDALRDQAQGDPRRVGEILVEKAHVPPQEIVSILKTQQDAASPSSATPTDTAVRVDVGLLDKLMNLVGELVLARNQVLQYATGLKDSVFLGTTQRLNLITTELQEGVMKTRMQPIGNVWGKFPRVVRDLAMGCGKQVRLDMEGKDTELDRTLLEAIKDPLTHLVRNSVDHGIEPPEVRRERGKPSEGVLSLRAFHEGGQVNIEIVDDGGGINIEKVKAKAVERGLISRDQSARMSDREASLLIFLPGFSTADKITNVSGRGVGMDVVKTNIEKIGGAVDISTRLGEGTSIKIKIPLTLAIIPALVVTASGDRYAIPQVSLLELVRLEGEQARKGVERIGGAPVYRLRGNLLPLVYLHKELKLDSGVLTQSGRSNQLTRFDFQAAREKHLAWKRRLKGVLENNEKIDESQLSSHRECDLGVWLYGEVMKNYGHLVEVQKLEKTHEAMHRSIKEVLQFKAQGDAGAEAAFQKMQHLSDRVVAALSELERLQTEQILNIVVLQADGHQFGLVVEDISDTEEIVVKPLSKQLKGIPLFAGATIMGDGRVALILDVLGIAQRAGVMAGAKERNRAEKAAREAAAANHQPLLLFALGRRRMAIPLTQVARLEEIQLDTVELADGQEVVQYRERIMPLLRLSSTFGEPSEHGAGPLQVVVYSHNGRSVGLVVERIVDIVEQAVRSDATCHRPGLAGSAVIAGHVTDVVDVPALVDSIDPSFFQDQRQVAEVH